MACLRPEDRRSARVMITRSATAIAASPQNDVPGTGITPTFNNATEVESVVDDTWVPAIPAISLKSNEISLKVADL